MAHEDDSEVAGSHETMEYLDPDPSGAPFLMVVQRGEVDRFSLLRSTFRDRPVDIVWDRRIGDRRQQRDDAAAGAAAVQRASDRRSAAPISWNHLGFLVAKRNVES